MNLIGNGVSGKEKFVWDRIILTPVTMYKMQETLEMIVHTCKRKCSEKVTKKKRKSLIQFITRNLRELKVVIKEDFSKWRKFFSK